MLNPTTIRITVELNGKYRVVDIAETKPHASQEIAVVEEVKKMLATLNKENEQ